jgi:NADH-quinone oxidoreductase subunit L
VKPVLFLLLLFPLLGAVVNALLGRYLPRRVVEVTACAGVLGALAMAAAALILAGDKAHNLTLLPWLAVGDFTGAMSVHYDPLAAVMALMVTFVSSIIHLYSVSFMREEEDYLRYFCYLNLFVFAMLVITVADNLLFVYLGWEGVGFCSYALIGFWYRDPAKADAGRKAFICTRIGDVAFGVVLALFFVLFHNLSLSFINSQASSLSPAMATLLGLLLLWAAVGKSAQLPLTVWLPDAMAGPSPVSALIHAATMVTAGVYLLMRLFPVVSMSPTAMLVIAGVGAVTTLYASLAALAQSDLKRVLAYSTISQVGYMILAVGAGDIVGGLFHLISHAFFKSLLFLAAGCVIQALAEEHNIFRMGNLRRLMPSVSWLFLAGAVSLSAFPLLGGYFSKDRILLATFLHPEMSYRVLWFLAAVAAVLTPVYTFRAFFVAFGERADGRRPEEVRPLPRFMAAVLWPLAVLALADGLLNLPGGIGKNFLGRYLAVVPGARPDLGAPPSLEWAMGLGSASLVLLALVLAYYLYRRRPALEPAREGFHEFLFSGLYLDKLYRLIFTRPYEAIAGFLWREVDERGIDQGFVKLAGGFDFLSGGLRLWTTGRLSTYLTMLLLGLAALLGALAFTWFVG